MIAEGPLSPILISWGLAASLGAAHGYNLIGAPRGSRIPIWPSRIRLLYPIKLSARNWLVSLRLNQGSSPYEGAALTIMLLTNSSRLFTGLRPVYDLAKGRQTETNPGLRYQHSERVRHAVSLSCLKYPRSCRFR